MSGKDMSPLVAPLDSMLVPPNEPLNSLGALSNSGGRLSSDNTGGHATPGALSTYFQSPFTYSPDSSPADIRTQATKERQSRPIGDSEDRGQPNPARADIHNERIDTPMKGAIQGDATPRTPVERTRPMGEVPSGSNLKTPLVRPNGSSGVGDSSGSAGDERTGGLQRIHTFLLAGWERDGATNTNTNTDGDSDGDSNDGSNGNSNIENCASISSDCVDMNFSSVSTVEDSPDIVNESWTSSCSDPFIMGLSAQPLRAPSSVGLIRSIGVGDGGNEVGMGKVYDLLTSSECCIKNATDIACVVPTDHLLVCSVSNWGGYALAAACAVLFSAREQVREGIQGQHRTISDNSDPTDGISGTVASTAADRARRTSAGIYSGGDSNLSIVVVATEVTETLGRFLPSDQVEVAMCQRMVEAGARDGVSGQKVVSVDGMPFEESLRVLGELRDVISTL